MIGFLSFISYPLVIVLHLESFENNLFKLGFSISKKVFFYGQTLLERWFFCSYAVDIFSRFFLPFHISKHFLQVSDHVFFKKIWLESATLKLNDVNFLIYKDYSFCFEFYQYSTIPRMLWHSIFITLKYLLTFSLYINMGVNEFTDMLQSNW